MNYIKLSMSDLEDAKMSAFYLLDKLNTSKLFYHRKEHTTDCVFPAALELADAEGFSTEDKVLVCIAAAFHDTGFLNQYSENESIGASFAEVYMRQSKKFTEDQIMLVKSTIKNTDMKSAPVTKYQKVLRDADLSYMGGEDKFMQWELDLKNELVLHQDSPLHKLSLNDKSWGLVSYNFIKSHKWFTKSAKRLYETNKQMNFEKLKVYYNLK